MIQSCKIISENTPIETYLREDVKRGDKPFVMSRSNLMQIALNPRRWLAGYGESNEDTKSTTWGSLVDCLALQPREFEKVYAVIPATYKSEGMECPTCKSVTDSKSCRKCGTERVKATIDKEWSMQSETCREWDEKVRASGRIPIASELWSKASKAVLRLVNEPDVKELLGCSKFQVYITGEWHDVDTGLIVPTKALLDIVPDSKHPTFGKCLADLKTCRSANPKQWGKVVFSDNYDAQAAMFTDHYTNATGEDRTDFIHVAQENFSPFEVLTPLPMLSVEFLELGRLKYQNALRKYCQCLKTGEWTGYAPTETLFNRQIIQPENWMI